MDELTRQNFGAGESLWDPKCIQVPERVQVELKKYRILEVMEYKGVPVDEMYKLWIDNQEFDKKRAEAGKVWDANYREKNRQKRNQKAREYYARTKKNKSSDEPSPDTQKDA